MAPIDALFAGRPFAAAWRMISAPLDPRIIKATGGG
jgi:hypothetical protein